ncbi:hypothetical protein [Actinomadura terrae]|uniref:hypothetical protein n=1 Tax=Actinomadura terrae TaxID=604353 RepID=UPI001FA73ED0|nr:hypothetical protein [Actinomadura terrae]
MNVAEGHHSRSFEPAEDLTPKAIEAFLRQSGWKCEEVREGISSIWSLDQADASIMLPYNRRFRDFRARLFNALDVIADVYNIRNSDELELKIAGAGSDILLLRADQATINGSIPLDEAKNLLTGVSVMLMAAACSAIKPSASIPRRRPDMAKEFMSEEVRMGHTLRGSFVLTIYARHADGQVEELPEAENVEASQESQPQIGTYSRRVMETLSTGLEASKELLNDDPAITLEEAVQHGASAEMIDSLGNMSQHPGLRALDMAFRWSPAQPAPAQRVASRVVLPRPQPERIEFVRDSLKSQPVAERGEIIGHVVRLERPEGHDSGIAVIDGYVGKSRKRVKVELSGESYLIAIFAHQERRLVVASGRLALERRSWWLKGRISLRIYGSLK